jgi:hypothetical protein
MREDGGGIRGYWTLLVLEMLMELVTEEEEKHEVASTMGHHSFAPEDFPSTNYNCTPKGRITEDANFFTLPLF